MIFTPENSVKIVSGDKTQTRRLHKPGDTLYVNVTHAVVYRASGRERWHTRKAYAIQPGRGRPAVGRIVLTQITLDRNGAAGISEEDARAEGYASREEFLAAWCWINGPGTLAQPVFVLTFQVQCHWMGVGHENHDDAGYSSRRL